MARVPGLTNHGNEFVPDAAGAVVEQRGESVAQDTPNVKALVYIAAFPRRARPSSTPSRSRQAAVMAASQRPGTLSSFVTPSGVPAWRTIPSWFLVAARGR